MADKNVKKNNVTNISTYSAVEGIKMRFATLLSILQDKAEILEEGPMRIITQGVKGLEEKDINDIMMHVVKCIKGTGLRPKDVEKILRFHLTSDEDWTGFNRVEELNGEMRIYAGNKMGRVANFTMKPKYCVQVHGDDLYYVYDVRVQNYPEVRTAYFTADDFTDVQKLKDRIKEQLKGTGAYLNLTVGNTADLHHKYVRLADFSNRKFGTSLIGLERLTEDGPKYFCTPNGIYDLDGNKSEDILYMANMHSNIEELRNLTNLEFHGWEQWRKVAKEFLSNVIQINEKNAMMSIVGWIGAIPHDYVIRKVVPIGFFPHCHIVGEPGSGKSTIMTILKQFMGHNDSAPRTFPTPFELSKLLNTSYTIPTVLDEYGKRWDQDRTNKINAILVECFTKSRWSRGSANLSSTHFKYKNPVLMGGQVPTNDQALSTRMVAVNLYKSFHNTSQGKKAQAALLRLQKMEDKNFWVGYCLWAAKHTNEEVEKKFKEYRKISRKHLNDNRIADIQTVVMLGLYYMKKLADELGADIGYTYEEEIEQMPEIYAAKLGLELSEDNSPLYEFLQDVAAYASTVGNSHIHGRYFGKGLAVCEYQPPNEGAGEYGRTARYPAAIYGRECILMKVNVMVNRLNAANKTNYNEREIMTFIDSEFQKTLNDPMSPNSLVLAPRQFKSRYGMYTVFSKQRLVELFPEYANIQWDK